MGRRLALLTAVCALLLPGETPPITLESAIEQAINHNLDLAAERYNVTVAEARLITARLRPNPVLTMSADHLDVLGTGFSRLNNAGPSEFSYRTDFVLERGGKRADRIALAEAGKRSAVLGVQDLMRRVVYTLISAFVDVQLAKQNLALARDNLHSLEGIVDVNLVRVRTGDLASVELTRSRVAALQYQTAVQQADLRLRQAKNQLLLLMGRSDADPDFDVAGDIRRGDVALPRVTDLRQRALAERPDLLALSAAQARSQADLKLQIAQGKADFTVGTEVRRQQGIAGRGNMMGVFFSAPLPVFNRNQGEIVRARQEMDQAQARLRALQASVNTEVTNALQQYETSRAMLAQIENSTLAQAREVRSVTEYSYRRGEASLVEFLDAQRAFNDAMQTYYDARASYARSLYLLESVTGQQFPAAKPGRQVAQTASQEISQ